MARGAFCLTLAFVGVQFVTNSGIWIHDFDSRYARKPIKDSQDSEDNLVSKKPWAKRLAH